jgi:hypothetical protein
MTRFMAWIVGLAFAFASVAPLPVLAQTAPKATESKPPAKTDTPVKTDPKKAEPIDLNSASELELKSLRGIGDAYSKKIIGEPAIIPQATYDAIEDQVIAKQATAQKPPAKKP